MPYLSRRKDIFKNVQRFTRLYHLRDTKQETGPRLITTRRPGDHNLITVVDWVPLQRCCYTCDRWKLFCCGFIGRFIPVLSLFHIVKFRKILLRFTPVSFYLISVLSTSSKAEILCRFLLLPCLIASTKWREF